MDDDNEGRKTQLTDAAYGLEHDLSQQGDDEYDARLVRFRGWEMVSAGLPVGLIAPPERLFFEANAETLKRSDYPTNSFVWPIVSPKMADALRSVGPVPHRLIPVVMLDDTVPTKKRLDENGDPRPGVAIEGFSLLQIAEFTPAIDLEKSEYSPHREYKNEIAVAKKLVLRERPLPVIFRPTELSREILVSAAGRHALEQAGVKGVTFLPLSQIQ